MALCLQVFPAKGWFSEVAELTNVHVIEICIGASMEAAKRTHLGIHTRILATQMNHQDESMEVLMAKVMVLKCTRRSPPVRRRR